MTEFTEQNETARALRAIDSGELGALGWTEAQALGWAEYAGPARPSLDHGTTPLVNGGDPVHVTGRGGATPGRGGATPGRGGATPGRGGATPGRVVAEHRDRYRVALPGGETDAVMTGRMRHLTNNERPAVGDWVLLQQPTAHGTAGIVALLPRTGVLRRKRPGSSEPQVIAANVDITLIAVSLSERPNARRIERYAALASDAGTTAVVVLTKLDVCTDIAGATAIAAAACPGAAIVALSASQGAGLEDLRQHLPAGRTAIIVGPSGAGKSTLTNALLGEDRLVTRAVRKDGKGRHATTHRELFRLPHGALLIDTPGLREVGLYDAELGVQAVFDDIAALARECRFTDCRHETEPGCAVLAAAADGTVAQDRLAAWRRLQRELDYEVRSCDRTAAAQQKARMKARQRAYRSHVQRKHRD